ncbi:proteobacterial dedicated sortase system histidine kinase [Photobacterium aphoticum]|uniref:histidine kinase n=2 Tax=Photobacterium aphoticum TaxID=754436 RepID=A0A0J1GJM9_9GAMM|nr:histidine kinase [Photobacterium aphoticum]PSU56875.1 proteobacterial dedicated sortase system histidine kinase [Photobacterium aphoticum]
MRFGFGLRTKVILIASLLLALPWVGYNYVLEMEKILRQGQEQTLIGTTRALATALNERPNLFNDQASFLQSVEKGRDLYAYDLNAPITLDGKLDDWADLDDKLMEYGRDYVQFSRQPYRASSLHFRHVVGKHDGALYAAFDVSDKKPVMRRQGAARVDRNDHLVIAMTTPSGEFHRYVIAAYADGKVDAWQLNGDINNPEDLIPTQDIQGYWRTTDTGYNIELRLPLSLLGSKLGFAFYDVNSTRSRDVETIIGTSNTNHQHKLGTVLVPSPEIEQILKGMGHTTSRIWVVDRHQRILAQTGDIQQSNGVWSTSIDQSEDKSWWSRLTETYLHPLYYRYLLTEPTPFTDSLKDAAAVQSVPLFQALQGRGYSQWRQSEDGNAMILSAAYPIWLDNNVMGAVIAEESTLGIQTLTNRALEELLNALVAIITIGTLTLFLFASKISNRIRRLRDEAEHAIDSQGRIQQAITPMQETDEIGDLSRSLAAMVSRLGQYNHYLENLSSRLSHELRTPVAVVRSSIENLAMQQPDEDAQRYIDRAQEGVQRLSTILSSMTEATRIEQSLQGAEKEVFPLNELVSGCLQGHEMAYASHQFTVKVEEDLWIDGAPDYLAQLLDKLIANAVDFSAESDPIAVTLSRHHDEAQLVVSNLGPLLPANMENQLLNSMVSVRSQDKQSKPHLGLGLFIARLITEYHNGTIRLSNRQDQQGVDVTIRLPLQTGHLPLRTTLQATRS